MPHSPTLRRILFATGGSGGHVFPALAIAEAAQRRWPQVETVFVTTGRPIENEICASAGVTQRVLPLLPLRSATRQPLQFLARAAAAYRSASTLIRDWQPDCVVGTGGWSMSPVVQAARRQRIPIILCEQNVIPGRATRWLARRAAVICTSFENTHRHLTAARRIVCTGNPVRQAIASLSSVPRAPDRRLLVLGGSQGARRLNHALALLARSPARPLAGWQITHQCGGHGDRDQLVSTYLAAGIPARVECFLPDMPAEYQRAELVVSRAGATTLAELACAQVPAILVPYPHAADDHQRLNASAFVEAGAARAVFEDHADGETAAALETVLTELLADPTLRTAMSRSLHRLARPDAAERVLVEIQHAIGQNAQPGSSADGSDRS
jgi:UDP-N-acetylglucosamine--N-acetylmuramyl-(pentapeptide) pyrophosphoryl-undecaprenol N-acetylglucosamine transferase